MHEGGISECSTVSPQRPSAYAERPSASAERSSESAERSSESAERTHTMITKKKSFGLFCVLREGNDPARGV